MKTLIKPNKKDRKINSDGTIEHAPFNYITMQKFVAISGMSRQNVYNLIWKKLLKPYHIGHLTFLSVKELNNLIESNLVPMSQDSLNFPKPKQLAK